MGWTTYCHSSSLHGYPNNERAYTPLSVPRIEEGITGDAHVQILQCLNCLSNQDKNRKYSEFNSRAWLNINFLLQWIFLFIRGLDLWNLNPLLPITYVKRKVLLRCWVFQIFCSWSFTKQKKKNWHLDSLHFGKVLIRGTPFYYGSADVVFTSCKV